MSAIVLSWTLNAGSFESTESVCCGANGSTLLPSPHYSASGKVWLEKKACEIPAKLLCSTLTTMHIHRGTYTVEAVLFLDRNHKT